MTDTLHTFVYGLHEGDHDFWYVGMTNKTDRRLKQHHERNPHATPDTQLHVLEEVTGTLAQVAPVEQEWIDGLRAVGYPLVNAERGNASYKLQGSPSAETRRKMSETHRGSTPWNKGLPARNRGVPVSEEARRKLSEALRGRPLSDEHKTALVAAWAPGGARRIAHERRKATA